MVTGHDFTITAITSVINFRHTIATVALQLSEYAGGHTIGSTSSRFFFYELANFSDCPSPVIPDTLREPVK